MATTTASHDIVPVPAEDLAVLITCVRTFVALFGPVERPGTDGAVWLARCRAILTKVIR